MPPALISRKKSQTIDEIFIKGPPLGGFVNYSYQQKETKIGKGDILLLMSDGFPEFFNQKDEKRTGQVIYLTKRSKQEIK